MRTVPSKRPEDLREEDEGESAEEESGGNSGEWCRVCDRESALVYKCDKCGKPF